MAINTITVSGNIGKDCVLRVTPNGKNIANFSLPVKQGYGEHEKTSWVSCKMFGGMAEKLTQHLTKGTKVTVSGEFVMETYTKDGIEKSFPVIVVSGLDIGSKPQPTSQPQQSNQGWGQSQPQQPKSNQAQANNSSVDFDDDIPF